MVSGSEKNALGIVHEAGGEATIHTVSRKLGIDSGYARLLCMSLARKDYVSLKRSGRFSITFKGKRAIGKTSSVAPEETDQEIPFKRLSQERVSWDVLPNARIYGCKSVPSLGKPCQDELGWETVKVDGAGRHIYEIGGRVLAGRLLAESTYPCSFCGRKGERPKGTLCPVCRGSKKVSINPPGVRCAYCKGRGEDKPRSNVTCIVCGGKGVVSITEPIEVCVRCWGNGAEPNNKLPCLKCRGKGVNKKRSHRNIAPVKADHSRHISLSVDT